MSRDQKFFDMYSLVIGALVVVTVGLIVLAMEMSERTQGVFTRETEEYREAVAERIRPVGQVYLPGEEQAADAPVVEVVAEPEPVVTAMTGPQVYNTACIACHSAGVGGAPIVGDASQWTDRIAQGIDMLYDHSINGFDGDAAAPMPAKGGRMDLSDQEVRDAVDFMVAESS